jgi:hypothetical protein
MAPRVTVESLTMRGIRMREGKSANELIMLLRRHREGSELAGRLAF